MAKNKVKYVDIDNFKVKGYNRQVRWHKCQFFALDIFDSKLQGHDFDRFLAAGRQALKDFQLPLPTIK